jgi:hypothetical protein
MTKTSEEREADSARLAAHCAEAQAKCRDGVMAAVRSRLPSNLFWIVIFALAALMGIIWNCTRETEAQVQVNGNRITRLEVGFEHQQEMLKDIHQAVVKKP